MTGTQDKALLASVLRQIEAHAEHGWPGNVRELEQAIRQVLIKASMNRSFFPKNRIPASTKGCCLIVWGRPRPSSVWRPTHSICIVNIRAMRPLHGFCPSIVELRENTCSFLLIES